MLPRLRAAPADAPVAVTRSVVAPPPALLPRKPRIRTMRTTPSQPTPTVRCARGLRSPPTSSPTGGSSCSEGARHGLYPTTFSPPLRFRSGNAHGLAREPLTTSLRSVDPLRDYRTGERRVGSDVPRRSGGRQRRLHAVYRRADP